EVLLVLRLLRRPPVALLPPQRFHRFHHLGARRHTTGSAEADDVFTFRRHFETPEADPFVPRVVVDHREAVLRRILAVVQQDVVPVTLHAKAITALRVLLRLEAPLDHRGLLA